MSISAGSKRHWAMVLLENAAALVDVLRVVDRQPAPLQPTREALASDWIMVGSELHAAMDREAAAHPDVLDGLPADTRRMIESASRRPTTTVGGR